MNLVTSIYCMSIQLTHVQKTVIFCRNIRPVCCCPESGGVSSAAVQNQVVCLQLLSRIRWCVFSCCPESGGVSSAAVQNQVVCLQLLSRIRWCVFSCCPESGGVSSAAVQNQVVCLQLLSRIRWCVFSCCPESGGVSSAAVQNQVVCLQLTPVHYSKLWRTSGVDLPLPKSSYTSSLF